ncbi:MAG: shikimate dehydrogenase [Gammaproteobacteria bacterium]|jgi:shikimate dehydrogenase|nr:shikimate dehydrogenase [Gammaproteobacteria bacterium]
MNFKLTVIGNPVLQSKSPWIHSRFAAEFSGLNVDYTKTEAPLDAFEQTVFAFRDSGANGANVTMPFKEQAYRLCDEYSERAQIAKAVNTLKFMDNGSIYGDNTDGIGFIRDLQHNHDYALTEKRILLLGAGGATRGLLYPLLQTKPHSIVITNRTLTKAQHLAAEFGPYGAISASDFEALEPEFDVMIDCTPFNSWPLPIANNIFHNCALVYDLKYSDKATPILGQAAQCGVKQCLDGFGMLVEQAAESFTLWTGLRPNTAAVLDEHKKHVMERLKLFAKAHTLGGID